MLKVVKKNARYFNEVRLGGDFGKSGVNLLKLHRNVFCSTNKPLMVILVIPENMSKLAYFKQKL